MKFFFRKFFFSLVNFQEQTTALQFQHYSNILYPVCWCLVRNMADPVGHKKHVKRSTQKDYSAILDHYRKNYVAVSCKLYLIDHLLLHGLHVK